MIGPNLRAVAYFFSMATFMTGNPGMCRSVCDPATGETFISHILRQALTLMLEVVDDPCWPMAMVSGRGEDQRDDDAMRGAEVGQEAVGRLAQAVGADLVLDTTMPALEKFRANPGNWR